MKRIIFALLISFLLLGCLQQEKAKTEVQKMGKKIVMVIAPGNFRDEELFHTKEVLANAGNEIKIASLTTDEVVGMLGAKAKPDMLLDEVKVEDFDAIVFVGGTGASTYFNNEKALQLAKNFYEANKVVAAICIAPSILANAGILQGKNVTSWPSEKDNINAKGGNWQETNVVKDGRIVTASGPQAAREFANKILEALQE